MVAEVLQCGGNPESLPPTVSVGAERSAGRDCGYDVPILRPHHTIPWIFIRKCETPISLLFQHCRLFHLYPCPFQFDFDSAQKKLEECEKLVENDFFLHIHRSQFMHEARMLICEMYCAIHSKVDLTMLAEKLKLTDEETER